MKLSRNGFIMIVAATLFFYGVVNVMLWREAGSFHFVDHDIFIIITSIFALMIMLCLPRTVEILLGNESQTPKSELYDKEISDSEYGS